MHKLRYLLPAFAFVFLLSYRLATRPVTAMAPSQVLVVYPTNGPDIDKDGVNDSKQLADYYVQKRGIPAANVLGVSISVIQNGYYYVGEYAKFYKELVAPIKAKIGSLAPQKVDVVLLVGAIPKEVRNSAGATVAVDNSLMMLASLDPNNDNISTVANPYFEPAPTFGKDLGHFDHSLYKHAGNDIYMVSRISNVDEIDQVAYADRFLLPQSGFYNGNVYVDSLYGPAGTTAKYTDAYLVAQPVLQLGNFGGTQSEADMNIAFAEHYVLSSGFPLKWENTPTGLSIGQAGATYSDGTIAMSAPRALFYAGWYNYQNYNDVWEWLPGSVVCDLNSSSLFATEAMRHGASAASYVVSEPYRTGHPRPNVLLYYLLNGYTFAEASTLATPTMGWVTVNEGDPLYTPTSPIMMSPTAEFPKTLVKDTFSPALSDGYPMISAGAQAEDRVVKILINDKPEPEVVVAQVEYGVDTNYGSTAKSEHGYQRRLSIALPGLKKNTVYHYRVTLKDPVGNLTVTRDSILDTSRRPE